MKHSKIGILLLITIFVVSLGLPSTTQANEYPSFFSIFKEGPRIPLISSTTTDAWVPQGLDYLPEKNWMLFTYYWKPEGTKPVALAVVDLSTNQHIKTVYLYETSTKMHSGHGSGVTVSKEHVWLASNEAGNTNNVFQFKIADLINASNGGKLIASKAYKLTSASYATYYDNVLWVGKFAHGSGGLCDPNPNGGNIYGYPLNSSDDLTSTTPTYTWKTPDRVQGAVMTADRVIYSQSCGRNNDSTLYTYTKGSTGKEVYRMTIPTMSEEIAIAGNNLYVNFESGAKEYRGTGKYPLYNVYYANVETFASRVSGKVTTNGANLNVRSGPGTNYSIVGSLANGTNVTIYCQTTGEYIDGYYGRSNIWNRIGTGKYIPDAYTYTGFNSQIAPTCK